MLLPGVWATAQPVLPCCFPIPIQQECHPQHPQDHSCPTACHGAGGMGCTPFLPSSFSSSSVPWCPQRRPNHFGRALGSGSGLLGAWVAGLDVRPWRGSSEER